MPKNSTHGLGKTPRTFSTKINKGGFLTCHWRPFGRPLWTRISSPFSSFPSFTTVTTVTTVTTITSLSSLRPVVLMMIRRTASGFVPPFQFSFPPELLTTLPCNLSKLQHYQDIRVHAKDTTTRRARIRDFNAGLTRGSNAKASCPGETRKKQVSS